MYTNEHEESAHKTAAKPPDVRLSTTQFAFAEALGQALAIQWAAEHHGLAAANPSTAGYHPSGSPKKV